MFLLALWGLAGRVPGSKPVAQADVLRRVLMGGISTNHFLVALPCGLCPGASTTPFSFCPFVMVGGGVGNVSGVWVVWWCLVHCWVLRQQALLVSVSVLRALCVWGGCGGWWVLFLVSWSCACPACVGWVWGTGLLFENYIVDASIL